MPRFHLDKGRIIALQISEHNIFSRIQDSDNYFLINPLSRQADILDADAAAEYRSGRFGDPSFWAEKGYLVDLADEARRYKAAYLNFLENRDRDEVQLFFLPTYACNFACSYCYQEGYEPHRETFREDVIDAFFAYVDAEFAGRRKYVTVFGGEPLLPGEATWKTVERLLGETGKRGIDVAFVTNGFHLEEYVPLLKTGRIREIQVTLDGVGEAHDKRRPHKAGKASFDRIVRGIDASLSSGMPVNLRMVLDKDNIEELPKLAAFARDKGWTKNPVFKTQLGRNYELHYCQKGSGKLYDRISLYQDIYGLVLKHPEILEFHRPAFSVSKFLWENGEMPQPLFDACPGTKTEWAFDFTGKIYSCTATVGKPGEELGTFFPAKSLKSDIVAEWEERDVTAIPECAACSLRLACGGGCGSVAKNKSGRALSPDCRPVKELLELGISLYFEKEVV